MLLLALALGALAASWYFSSGQSETSTTVVVSIPDTVGQDEATARATLEGAGFAVRVTTRPVSDPAQDGIVVEPEGQVTPVLQGLVGPGVRRRYGNGGRDPVQVTLCY